MVGGSQPLINKPIEVTGNSATQTLRDRLKELIKEFSAVLKPLDSSRIIYLGTPQTEQSIYNALPDRGYEIRIIPVQYPTPEQQTRYGPRLAKEVSDDLETDPSLAGRPFCTRFNADVVLEKLAEYGRAGFALQFMLDTSLADADRYPLKLRDLIVMDLDLKRAPVSLAWGSDAALTISDVPTVGFDGDRLHKPFMVSEDWSEYTGKVMAIDPSGRGTDETTYAVVYFHHGRLFVMDVGGFKGGYEDSTLEALCHRARDYGVHEVIVEPNFG